MPIHRFLAIRLCQVNHLIHLHILFNLLLFSHFLTIIVVFIRQHRSACKTFNWDNHFCYIIYVDTFKCKSILFLNFFCVIDKIVIQCFAIFIINVASQNRSLVSLTQYINRCSCADLQ
jgi:hypothetical protein